MLKNISWTQLMLPLLLALVAYYGWVLLTYYRKDLVHFFSGEQAAGASKELGLGSRGDGNGSQDILPGKDMEKAEVQNEGISEFVSQLRIYLEPYGGQSIDWSGQQGVIGELIFKCSRMQGVWEKDQVLGLLKDELMAFNLDVPSPGELELFWERYH